MSALDNYESPEPGVSYFSNYVPDAVSSPAWTFNESDYISDEMIEENRIELLHKMASEEDARIHAWREANGIYVHPIHAFVQCAARHGILTNMSAEDLLLDTPGHVNENKSEVCIIDRPLVPTVPRPHRAENMYYDLFPGLIEFAESDSFDVPEDLAAMCAHYQEMKYDHPAMSDLERTVKTNIKHGGRGTLQEALATLSLENRPIKVLVVGCGTGFADIQRCYTANQNSSRNIIVDLYDPYVKINPKCRELGSGQYISGRNLAMQEHYEFGTEVYDVLFSMNALHYYAKTIGGVHGLLTRLLESVKTGGFVCGQYPSMSGFATCTRSIAPDHSPNNDAFIRLLALEPGDSGLQMATRVGDEVFHEPVLEPSVLQAAFQSTGFIGNIFSNLDAPRFLSNYPSYYRAVAEADGFTSFIARRLIPVEKPIVDDMPFLVPPLVPKQITRLACVPDTYLNHGIPLRGNNIWKFVAGGMWLFSEKTDGIPANCLRLGEKLYVYPDGYDPFILPVPDGIRVSFQAEIVDSHLVLIQVNTLQSAPVSFGSGMMTAHQLKKQGDALFNKLVFKEWRYSISEVAYWKEGIVVMDFRSPPPEKLLPMHSPTKRVSGSAIYIKREYTVDLYFKAHERMVLNHGKIYSLPPESVQAAASVHEFTLDGKYIKHRVNLLKGNSDKTISGIHNAIPYKKFMDTVLVRYYSKWKALHSVQTYVMKDFSKWTLAEMFALAISYPRGFLDIGDRKVRDKIYLIRSKCGDIHNLNSVLMSDTYNVMKNSKDWIPTLQRTERAYEEGKGIKLGHLALAKKEVLASDAC